MITSYFYNESMRRYVIVFGTMFNNIHIKKRQGDNTTEAKEIRVPLAYGPAEKFLVRGTSDADFTRLAAIELPRMSFEINGMVFASDRKLPTTGRWSYGTANSEHKASIWAPVPYDINFQLNIISKSYDDGTAILEQILPYFTPAWTNTVNLIDEVDISLDVPLILVGVSNSDTYDGEFKERRTIIWTLDFVMKGYFFGPTSNKKIIKIANTNMYDALTSVQKLTTVRVRPGLTANGEPTTDESESIPALDIGVDDDWDYIVTVTDA